MWLYYKEQQKRDYYWFLVILQAKEKGKSTRSPAGTSTRGPGLAKIKDGNKYWESNTYPTYDQWPRVVPPSRGPRWDIWDLTRELSAKLEIHDGKPWSRRAIMVYHHSLWLPFIRLREDHAYLPSDETNDMYQCQLSTKTSKRPRMEMSPQPPMCSSNGRLGFIYPLCSCLSMVRERAVLHSDTFRKAPIWYGSTNHFANHPLRRG